jgi:hypothetical protein
MSDTPGEVTTEEEAPKSIEEQHREAIFGGTPEEPTDPEAPEAPVDPENVE